MAMEKLEKGWAMIRKTIDKVLDASELGFPDTPITSEDYIIAYTMTYQLCIDDYYHNYKKDLYDRYCKTFEEHVTLKVLPALREKHNELLLREFVKQWSNHKRVVHLISHISYFLNRHFDLKFLQLEPTDRAGLTCFRNLGADQEVSVSAATSGLLSSFSGKTVCQKYKVEVRDAVISLINREREGEVIDQALLKSVVDIFIEIELDSIDFYVNDLEEALLETSRAYYSQKASKWISEYSYRDYISKAKECQDKEKDRVSRYLHSSSIPKLLKIVQRELLVAHARKLLEMKSSERQSKLSQ